MIINGRQGRLSILPGIDGNSLRTVSAVKLSKGKRKLLRRAWKNNTKPPVFQVEMRNEDDALDYRFQAADQSEVSQLLGGYVYFPQQYLHAVRVRTVVKWEVGRPICWSVQVRRDWSVSRVRALNLAH